MSLAIAVQAPRRNRPSFDRGRLVAIHARRAPIGAVCTAAVIGGFAVVVRAVYANSSHDVLPYARLSAVIISAAAAGALENSCSAITSTTSLRRSVSASLSAVLTGAAALVGWIGPVLVARGVAGDPRGMPIGGLVIELIALLLVGWLMTEVISALRGPSGAGTLAGASLTLAVVMTLMTPYTIGWLWRGPDPDWRVVHVRWALIGAITIVLLAIAVRDAAATWPSLRRVLAMRSASVDSVPIHSARESDES